MSMERGGIGRAIRVAAAATALSTLAGCSWDNPFKKDDKPTVKELFAEANQDCANDKSAAMRDQIENQGIPADVKVGDYETMTNTRLAQAVTACVVDRTGIPAGTPGFDIEFPTIEVTGSAVVVEG